VTATPVLPGVLASLAPLLDHYGYLAVAVLIVVEDFGVPVPGETVLIAGAVYAGAGHLNIIAVTAIAIAAAVLGSVLWVAMLARLGFLAGNHIAPIYEQVQRYQVYVLLAVGAALAALIVRHLLRCRRASV
jgi:membrane protein DedA with SNARE-associated domain